MRDWSLAPERINILLRMADGSEQFITLTGDRDIRIHLRRSARARRLSLRVSRLDGKATLTVPSFVGPAEAHRFAKDRRDWLLKAIGGAPDLVAVQDGITLPIEGQPHRVVLAPVRRPEREDGVLVLPSRAPGAAAKGLLKALATERLRVATDAFAAQIGRHVRRLTLRDTRSRWGSCSSQGNLMFSWRLILAPPEVLTYVAAHEVAHLTHMDHSRAFWTLVEEIYPAYEAPRTWLRTHAAELHRYRFGD